MPLSPLPDVDASHCPVVCRATDYAAGTSTGEHFHPNHHQLIHSLHGVMTVTAKAGRWIVPPTRAIWMPAGMTHSVRYLGNVQMRSLFIRSESMPGLASQAEVVGVSPLLRELIRAAVHVAVPYSEDSRDGRLMRLVLDELHTLPVLPMHLPRPGDLRLQRISARLQLHPDDPSTLEDWARRLDLNTKTLQRLFLRDTGMSFGRWRQQARLLHALERLAQGERVIDVALASGYDSAGAFATMFKRHFGQTPSGFFK